MKEKKKMKTWLKVLLIVIGALFISFVALVGFMLYHDFSIEAKLNREVEEIEDIMNATEFDEEKFKEKLDHSVSSGDYHKVERAYKNYLRDYYLLLDKIEKFYDSIDVNNILSIENIEKDGKDFIQTRIKLESYKKECESLKEKFDSFSDEKVVMSYLNSDLDEYYVDYFKKIIGDVSQTAKEKELSRYLSVSSEQIKGIKDIFDFLSSHKANWDTDGQSILFDNEQLLNEYQALYDKITSITFDEEESNTSSEA